MQNKNKLAIEEEKNKNNVFMSKDLEGLFEEFPDYISNFHKASFELILEFNNNELLKSEILKLKFKKNIFTLTFFNSVNLSNVFLNNSVKKFFIEDEDEIIIDQEISNCDVNYTIKLVDNNIYKYKIKIVRNKDGI